MNETIVEQVGMWFAQVSRQLCVTFSAVNYRMMRATDKVRGKVIIELDGGSAVIMITFWNKGDVQALILERKTKREHTLDDRMLTADDRVASLLESYLDKFTSLVSGMTG